MDKMSVYAVWLKLCSRLSVRLEDGLFSFGRANIEAAKVGEDWWYRADWAQARGKSCFL